MEFHIRTTSQPDLQAIEQRLLELDPAGLVDLDAAGVLRLSTLAQANDLVAVMAAAGHPVALRDIEQQASVCCGGCSG